MIDSSPHVIINDIDKQAKKRNKVRKKTERIKRENERVLKETAKNGK